MKENTLMKQWLQYQLTSQGPLLQLTFYWSIVQPKPDVKAVYVQEFLKGKSLRAIFLPSPSQLPPSLPPSSRPPPQKSSRKKGKQTAKLTPTAPVLQILNSHLEGRQWLVGDKCSAADLSYVAFHSALGVEMGDDAPDVEREFPAVESWYRRLCAREAVGKVIGEHVESRRGVVPPTKKE